MYEIIEHTADVGLLVKGGRLEEFFMDAARGMFAIICGAAPEGEALSRGVAIQSEDIEGLLVGWLSELLFLFESEGFVPREFVFDDLGAGSLEATCVGSKAYPQACATEVKAVTHHLLEVEETSEGWEAKIYFDL